MSLPQKEELGVKLFVWNTNELTTGVPIKKRRFLFRRSPSPPPHSTTLTAEHCDQQPKGTDSPAAESSVSEVSDQVSDSGFTNIRDSSLECRVENATDKEVNLSQNCESSPSFSGKLSFTLSTTADAAAGCSGADGIGHGEKLISEKRSSHGLILGKNLEVTDFRSTLGDGMFGNKLISSDKSAFQRVLANTELPWPLNRQSSGEPVVLGTSAKEGQFSSCKLELTFSESQFSSLSKQPNSQLGLRHDDQHSNRSHWDLNTTMDAWESSVVDTTSKHRDCANDKDLDMGVVHFKRPEMDPLEKSQQESTGPHIMSGSYALLESACSLKLPSTLLKPLGENCGINTDLNLQLNTNFGSMSLSNLGVPFASNIPSTHKISNFSSLLKPITLNQSTNLTVCNSVKTEPVEQEGGNGENMGACNFKSVSKSIIKSEALDTVEQEALKMVCPSDVSTPCGSVVKSEQLEVPRVEGPRAAEGKTQYHGIDTNAYGTVSTWEMHRDVKGGVALSLDLVTQGLAVDCNKVHDIPGAANIVTSKALGESTCKAMPVLAADPPVLNETNLDLGEGMPSNADQACGASPNIGSPTKIIPRSIISCNDSESFYLAPACVVTRDSEASVLMAAELLSESNATVGTELSQIKGASEAVNSTSLLDSVSKEQTVADYIPGNDEHMPYSDGAAQLCGLVPVDVCTSHTSFDSKVIETDVGGEVRKTESCKTVNEACGSHEAAGAKEIASKLHGDDDEYEDGELRESLLRDAIKGSRNTKEKKGVNIKEGVKSDVPVIISSLVSGNENELQSSESKDVHCTTEFESFLGTEKIDAGLNVSEDEKESPVIGMPVIESSKKKSVKVSYKMPEESGKDNSETKTTCEKILRCSLEKGPDNTGYDLGSQLTNATANWSGPAQGDASRTYDVSDHIRSDQSNVVHLSSSSKASSGRIKPSRGRSSSRSERERVKDKALKREKVHMKSSRDESHIHQMHKSEKERDQDQTLRMAGSGFVHIRGRNRQSDILHGACYPDRGYASEHFNMSTSSQLSRSKNASEVAFAVGMDGMFESAGRTGKRHMDDELCRPPPRRPSPGGRGPPSVGVQMVRRTMRDVSPGRCIEGGIPELVMLNHEGKLMRDFADDMVNSSLILHARPNYEPVENCLNRRERSLSPFRRRAAPHVPHMPFASLTSPRVRSPHLWSPRRSPDGFDGCPDPMRCRSPDLRVERVRSPGERACFQENMLGRRHFSPHMAQLHGEMADVNLLRGHDLPKSVRYPRGNPRSRRFEVIDHRGNSDNLGHLQSGQFRGLEGDDVYVEERRNSDEGQGLARPFRQHYMVGDGVSNDGSFHRRVEDIPPPRPIRFCQDVDGEFPGRNISRGSGIRNRLGNMHRRGRGVDELEDNYRHDNGQGWHGDVRLKRRRF